MNLKIQFETTEYTEDMEKARLIEKWMGDVRSPIG